MSTNTTHINEMLKELRAKFENITDWTTEELELISKHTDPATICIGYKREYCTLWRWRPYSTMSNKPYDYLQNLKQLTESEVYEKYPHFDIDLDLRGDDWYSNRELGTFPYGKYRGEYAIDCEDVDYMAWWLVKDAETCTENGLKTWIENNQTALEEYTKKSLRQKSKDFRGTLLYKVSEAGYKFRADLMKFMTDEAYDEKIANDIAESEKTLSKIRSCESFYFAPFGDNIDGGWKKRRCDFVGFTFGARPDTYYNEGDWRAYIVDDKGKNKMYKKKLLKVTDFEIVGNTVTIKKWSIVPKVKFDFETKSYVGLPDGIDANEII